MTSQPCRRSILRGLVVMGPRQTKGVFMTINWGNPYADRAGQWLKGNLHAHTSPASPCAVISRADLLAAYAEQGYDFLSISDHLALTEAEHPDLVLIPGAEWIEREMHDLYGINFKNHPRLERLILADDWPEGNYPLRKEKQS